jgi:hypothetical protein
MNPHIWQLHAAVFDLAQAGGLRDFVVHYEDFGDHVEISLAMPPAARDEVGAREVAAGPPELPC